MRTRKAFLNTVVGLLSALITTFLSFFLNKVFLSTLGLDYLGLNGIFSNALGMLSLTELGIGIAISYELYAPLAQNDTRRVSALMNLYKKAYHIIAVITFLVGIVIGIFVCVATKTSEIPVYESFIYFFLFLCNNCCTYLLAYKRTLLEVDQRSYIISTITTCTNIIGTIGRILVLYFFANYVLYIAISIVQTVVINIIVSVYIDRNHLYLKNSNEKLDKSSCLKILSEVKSRIVIKLCSVLVSSTDNIIIGSLINLTAAGLFQNYSLVVGQLGLFIFQIENAVTASLGNFVALRSRNELEDIVGEIEFLEHCIGTFCVTCFCILISPFIRLWIGDYVLPMTVPFLLMCNVYITYMMEVYWQVNNMTIGFKNNKRIYFHLMRAALNLFVSLVGAKFLGITGVVLGTVISAILIWCTEVSYTYRVVLKVGVLRYIQRQLAYIAQMLVILLITYRITSLLKFNGEIMNFVMLGLASSLLVILLICVANARNPYLYRFFNRIKIIITKELL